MTDFFDLSHSTDTAPPDLSVPGNQSRCLCDDERSEFFLNDWPDGTPKSLGTDFTSYMDGQPSIFSTARSFRQLSTGKSASRVGTEARERAESGGKSIGTIQGMSVYGDTSTVDPRKFHVTNSA
jgi:hypothetical protein